MPIEVLWRWLRENVNYQHRGATADDLTRRVAAFRAKIKQNAYAIAYRLWAKGQLSPEGKNLQYPN